MVQLLVIATFILILFLSIIIYSDVKLTAVWDIYFISFSHYLNFFQEVQSIEGKTKFNVNMKWTDISFLTFQPKANEPQDDIIKIDSLQNCVCSFKGKTYIAITQLILHICLRGALWGFQNGKQNKKSNCKNIRDQGSHVQKHWYKTTVVGSRSICLKSIIIFVLLMYDKCI